MTTTTARRSGSDATLAAAVDVARAAADEVAAPAGAGEHLGADLEGERLVTHRFACLDAAYTGWHWAVTLTRAPRSKAVTVSEVVLLPGADALLAKAWVPWSQRLAPGDLGVGDLLPTEADDDRLEPGYLATGLVDATDDTGDDLGDADDDTDRVAVWELGLGRPRVLSSIGRDDTVDRWYSGEHGPTAAIAQAAPAHCASCGFLTPMGGSLRRVFGVCANAFSPSDGRVVSYDHGCGAHSEVAVLPGPVEVTAPLVDEVDYDVISLRPVEHTPGSVDDAADAEDLGHS
ncbi:MAG TPA: DUF3027 domain-containing protein [Actinomycetes bacterium]